MTRLGDFQGRDNNFNLIRFLAATLVIWSHAFRLLDHPQLTVMERSFGLGPGDLGVDIFFVLSGFLVSRSLESKTLAGFIWARWLRIYPALWVSIVLSVLVAALCFSDAPVARFLTSGATVRYLWRNAILLPPVGAEIALPHAFPYADGRFNLSLWTLPYELGMYGLLALVGKSFGLRARYVGALAAIGATLLVLLHELHSPYHMVAPYGRFLCLFFAGAFAHALRSRIVLSSWFALGLVCAIAATVAITQQHFTRQAILLLTLPYLLLWLGLVPGGALRLWNRLGDYSYGMYIYACPVQIALVSTGAATTGGRNFLLAVLITLPLAVTSWHALEKRALRIRPPPFLAHALGRRAPAAAVD